MFFEFILQSRETARTVWLAATAVYAALAVATALWFGFSRRASLRLRVAAMAVLIVAGPLGYVATIPLAGNVLSFVIVNTISGGGYYEWKAAKDAAEAGKTAPAAPAR